MKPKLPAPPPEPLSVEELLRRFAADLPGLMRRFRVPGAECDDAAQDALERIFRSAGEVLNHPRGRRFALLRLAYDVAVSRRRKAARLAARNTGAPVDDLPWHRDLEEDVALFEAIDGLAEPFREAVIASDVYGLPDEEIAASMGKTLIAFRHTLHSGRVQVRRKLRPAAVIPIGLGLGLTPVQRAAFAAMLRVEGRSPIVGGPVDPPPPPPEPPSGWLRRAAARLDLTTVFASVLAAVVLGFCAIFAPTHAELRAAPEGRPPSVTVSNVVGNGGEGASKPPLSPCAAPPAEQTARGGEQVRAGEMPRLAEAEKDAREGEPRVTDAEIEEARRRLSALRPGTRSRRVRPMPAQR